MASFKDCVSQAHARWQPRGTSICKGTIEGLAVLLLLLLIIHFLLAQHQQAHLQVLLGVGLALLGASLLLGCALCWHRRKKCHRKACQGPAPVRVGLGLGLPPRTTAVAVQQHAETEGQAQDTSPPSVDDVPGLAPRDSPPQSLRRGRGSLPSVPLFQEPSPPFTPPWGRERRRTIAEDSLFGSESDLLSRPILGAEIPPSYTVPGDLASGSGKPRPQLHFALSYRQSEAVLMVTVIGVSHLPRGVRAGRNSYVKVRLLPNSAAPQRTALRRKSLNPEFHEQFCFGSCSLEALPSLTLCFAVYAKEFHNLRDSFIGEVMFPCSQVARDPCASSTYTLELSSVKTKLKKCLSAQDVSFVCLPSQATPAGQLFLLLQYQALANRIKVLVRKAENLGRLRRMPGTPDHFIVIQLYHNGKLIDTKETKSIAGYNPVWNSPFLFSIPVGDIQEEDLSLEFTVMQTRIYTRTCTVGRVLIGPDAPEMGQTHWKEMCSRGNVESARWHSILPESFQSSP